MRKLFISLFLALAAGLSAQVNPIHRLPAAATGETSAETAGKDLLDSMYTYYTDSTNIMRTVYEYYDDGRKHSGFSYYSIAGSAWKMNGFAYCFYDAEGNLTKEKTGDTYVNADSVQFDNQTIYTYDDAHRVLTMIEYTWNNNAWKGYYRYEYTYNAEGRLTEEIQSSWFDSKNDWKPTNKHIHTYDAAGNELQDSMLYMGYSDTTWANSRLFKRTYDEHNNVLTFGSYRWSSSQWSAEERHQYDYTYDADGNILTNVDYYSYQTSAWRENYKYEYTYNDKGHMLSETAYSWNNAWLNYYRHTYGRDAHGNCTMDLEERWSDTDSAWNYNGKKVYYYSLAPITSLTDTDAPSASVRKVLRDGRVLILTADGTFDMTGRRVE